MGEKLVVWDQPLSAYKLTESGRSAVLAIEEYFHREKQADLARKLRGGSDETYGLPEVDADKDVAPHVLRFFFNLGSDAKDVKATLNEVKQSLEFGGVTLEENLSKLVHCIGFTDEIGRTYSWLCDLAGPLIEDGKNQQKILLENTMREVDQGFAEIQSISQKLITDSPPSGDFAAKLLCILHALCSRRGSPFLGDGAECRSRRKAFSATMMSYVGNRGKLLVERLERDFSVSGFVKEIYDEHCSLRYMSTCKLTSEADPGLPTDQEMSAESLGAFIFHSILEAAAGIIRASKAESPLQTVAFSEAAIVGGGQSQQREGSIRVILPVETDPVGAGDGNTGDADLLRLGWGMKAISAAQRACETIDESLIASAIDTFREEVGGDPSNGRRRHRTLEFVSIHLHGLRKFINEANVSVRGFPHSTSMKSLFHLHSKSMHLSESMETVRKMIRSLEMKHEIILDEAAGTKALVVENEVPHQAEEDAKAAQKALMLVIAKLSDCLTGEIKTAAENLFRSAPGGNHPSPGALFDQVDVICGTMLTPILETLENTYPVTQRKFALQGAVSVLHQVLLRLKAEVKLPVGTQDLASGLRKALDLVGTRKLVEMIQKDTDYHLYESSIVRSHLVMKLLDKEDPSTPQVDLSLLPDLEDWARR